MCCCTTPPRTPNSASSASVTAAGPKSKPSPWRTCVTSAYGMDPSGYSLPYVAGWAGTDKPADMVRATARRVVGAAQRVLASLELAPGGQPPGPTKTIEPAEIAVGRERAGEAIGL